MSNIVQLSTVTSDSLDLSQLELSVKTIADAKALLRQNVVAIIMSSKSETGLQKEKSRRSCEASKLRVGRTRVRKERSMIRLQAFQTAARQGGFVKVSESGEGDVLWLRKTAPDSVTETHQRMCIDSLTNSATVYWMTAPGKVSSKTFRVVAALQEWFKLIPQAIAPR